jgi:predicted RNA-binding Zn ribbon-like protein
MAKRRARTPRVESLPEERDGFKFRAGRLALDFVATVAGRLKPVPTDLLATPRDLDRWLAVAELERPSGLRAASRALADARMLREALHRLFTACIRAEPYSPADRALVNRWAAKAVPAPQVGRTGNDPLRWTRPDLTACLAAIARDGVTLLAEPQSRRIRKCARDGCAILFLDSSRAGGRRWCSMTACGNKDKVARFRRREGQS